MSEPRDEEAANVVPSSDDATAPTSEPISGITAPTSAPISVEPEPVRPSITRLHPDHVASMLRAEELDRKLTAKQRTIESLEADLRKSARDLEVARREAADVPKPRPATRAGLLAAGAVFGAIAVLVLSAVASPSSDDGLVSSPAEPDRHPLDLPLTGPAPSAPSIGADFAGWRGHVVTSASPSFPRGTRCEVSVAVTPGNDLACQARIDCAGRTIYGPAPSGLFVCRIDGLDANGRVRISGRDDEVTAGDGDPAMRIDTTARSVRVWESSYGRETFDVTIALDPA